MGENEQAQRDDITTGPSASGVAPSVASPGGVDGVPAEKAPPSQHPAPPAGEGTVYNPDEQIRVDKY